MNLHNGLNGSRVDKHVGGRLRLFRVGVGMSIEYFATRVGAPVYDVERWESGTERIPSEHILACAAVLHLHFGELFEGLD